MKNLVYASTVDTAEELLQRVQNGCTSVRNTPGIFQRVRQSIHHRAEVCVVLQRPTFWAPTVTTTIVTSCHSNVNLHF
jgi:hypothetical protein